MDLVLPDIKGCEIIRGMRAALDDVLIIAYSGYEELLPLAIDAGADSSVLKPNLDGLRDVLAIGGAIGELRRWRRPDHIH
jgi:CheY-like chemotaxis protein